MSHAPVQTNSIIAADFGNVQTRALLIELVEGAYTLIASVSEPSTHAFPASDPNLALMRALKRLSEMSGRRLVANDRVIVPEQANRSGADAFVATSSVGLPLRTVVMGLMPAYSLASAVRATAGTYVSIVRTMTLEEALDTEAALNAILLARPDLIFLSGGLDGGAVRAVRQLADAAALAVRLLPPKDRPMILYAGNNALAGEIQTFFSDITTVFVAPNVRPKAQRESIAPAQLQLAAAFDALTAQRARGFMTVAMQSKVGVLPNAQSYQLVADFMGRTAHGNVLVLDVGSATSTLAASVRGQTSTTIRTEIGVGHSAASLLDAAGMDSVRAWLPFAASDNEIRDYALNKAARPALVPDSVRALFLEHALLRAAQRLMLNASAPNWSHGRTRPMPHFARILGAGAAVAGTGRPGMAAMLLLDSLQPVGVSRLELDPDALIPALGAVARFSPQAVVQLLDKRGLDPLAVCLSLSGQPRPERPVAHVRLTLPNGEIVHETILGGQLWVYPLGVGVRARLEVRALGRHHIGGRSRVRMEVVGGTAGVIVDARGRPLPLATTVKGLAAQLTAWYAQATGDPIREIQTEWLEDILMENMGATPEQEGPKGRGRKRKTQAVGVPAPLDDSLPALDDLTAPTPDMPAVRNNLNLQEESDDLRSLLS